MKLRIILFLFVVFVVAPVLAKITSSLTQNKFDSPQSISVSPLTKEEASVAILARNEAASETDKYNPNFTVEKVDKISQWWYVAIIQMDGQDQSVLLSKFTNNSVQAKTNPGVGLPYLNISEGAGIPYDAIDKFNKALDDHGHDQE